jgi:hypothetical protein
MTLHRLGLQTEEIRSYGSFAGSVGKAVLKEDKPAFSLRTPHRAHPQSHALTVHCSLTPTFDPAKLPSDRTESLWYSTLLAFDDNTYVRRQISIFSFCFRLVFHPLLGTRQNGRNQVQRCGVGNPSYWNQMQGRVACSTVSTTTTY